MDIRPLKPEEYEEAIKLLERRCEWGEHPPPGTLIGAFNGDGKLIGIIRAEYVAAIDALVTEDDEGEVAKMLCAWVDRHFYPQRYFFFISEKNERFCKYIERKFSNIVEGFKGTLYVRWRKS